MSQLLPCPTCDRITPLRDGVSPEAKVRCPHCQGEFLLGELLESGFEQWEIVDEPDGACAAAPSDPAVPQSSESESRELKLSDAGPGAAPVKKPTDWSNFQPITHEQFERMKRKSASPLWPVLQVVLGGVAAVPIALLLVWHLIGTDVGGAGPLVGQYVPWIVPERFRPLAPDNPEAADHPAIAGNAEGSGRQFDDLGATQEAAPGDAQPQLGISSSGSELELESESQGASPTDTAGTSLPTDVPPTWDDSLPTAGTDDIAAQNIFTLIRQAEQHLDEWSVAVRSESADLKQLAQAIYGDLTSLASAIDKLPKENPVLRIIRDRMHPISRTVQRKPDVRSLIDQGARYWVRSRAKSNSVVDNDAAETRPVAEVFGLAATIEIAEIAETDTHWIVVASEATMLGDPPIEIHVPKVLAPSLIRDQTLFLLGMVSPAENSPQSAPRRLRFVASYVHGL